MLKLGCAGFRLQGLGLPCGTLRYPKIWGLGGFKGLGLKSWGFRLQGSVPTLWSLRVLIAWVTYLEYRIAKSLFEWM